MQNNEAIAALAQQLLSLDEGELKPNERAVIERCVRRLAVSRNINVDMDTSTTFGQHIADRVAEIGGSWSFIIGFGIFLVAWAVLNGVLLARHAIDPYPFIFLNLLLSMLAAVQAPVIMMSQNRQAAKDRLAAALDYEVNVKAELAIAELHAKMDRLEGKLDRVVEPEPRAARGPELVAAE